MNMAAKPDLPGISSEPYATTPAPGTLRIERVLPGPAERVWAYLTESDKRARWFAAGPMELRDGGAMALTFRNSDLSGDQPNPHGGTGPDGIDHVMNGVISRCEPPHLLVFNWSPDGTGTETTFELSKHGTDTKLVITQRRVDNRRQLLSMTAGWHVHVGILSDLLSETTPRHFWPEHVRLSKVYDEKFAG